MREEFKKRAVIIIQTNWRGFLGRDNGFVENAGDDDFARQDDVALLKTFTATRSQGGVCRTTQDDVTSLNRRPKSGAPAATGYGGPAALCCTHHHEGYPTLHVQPTLPQAQRTVSAYSAGVSTIIRNVASLHVSLWLAVCSALCISVATRWEVEQSAQLLLEIDEEKQNVRDDMEDIDIDIKMMR